ncbi:pimeloyl-ACP methyl ester carboxylesterase [Prauserella sediminis]|uniref:Pimeloyl-ACP methyl ester carboxylesterase n=1 Tax=Prauserella sediminis TaxID=577680 RepID=A0A839XMG1_9PSEU|nr:alpha/beta fold hydrolase [Prauserella sediminis]MBB3662704.1 pimeloyl-ACP methyl ester carboxylesterase [Prauserella sediminis]
MTDEFAAHRHQVGGISYVDVGEGPVTLFVHGVFTNGRLWRNVVQRLRGHRRCIVVDLPGHGCTPPLGEASLWGLADAVGTVLTELDLWDVHLVGNDTGGGVCQIVMARHESRFASWVLTNCDTEGNTPPRAFAPVVWASRLGLFRVTGPVVRWPALAKQILRVGYRRPAELPDDVVVDYLAPRSSAAVTRCGSWSGC